MPLASDNRFLDLTMPRLDGSQCLLRLRALRADNPVLVMSGYAAHATLPAEVRPAPAFLNEAVRFQMSCCTRATLCCCSPQRMSLASAFPHSRDPAP